MAMQRLQRTMKKSGNILSSNHDGVLTAMESTLKINNCRTAHPYTFTIEESPQLVGANLMNLTSTEPSTFVNEDTWSVESECPSGTGEDPTEEVRFLECRARTSLADMERGICHGKCQDCEQRFSHATEEGRR